MFKAGRGRSSASSSLTMKKIKVFFNFTEVKFFPFFRGGGGEGVYTLLIVSTEWGLNGFRASFQELLVAIPDSRPLQTRILPKGRSNLPYLGQSGLK